MTARPTGWMALAAAMAALVAAAAVTLTLSLARPADAAAAYCGHGYRNWWADTPQGTTLFRTVYAWGWTGTHHGHHYRVVRFRPANNSWSFVRSFSRNCPNRHPV